MLQKLAINPESLSTALIVVDQQIDFQPGGALPVKEGDLVVERICDLMHKFKTIVLSQDSHPKGHISFASSHEGKKPYDVLSLDDLNDPNFESQFSRNCLKNYLLSIPLQKQTLWPDHCVPGTPGWEFDPRLPVEKADLILRKGKRIDCDSYSVFQENDGLSTGLAGYLREKNINTLYVVGLAGDYCVNWSAYDAAQLGFKVIYDFALTRFVDPGTVNINRVVQRLRHSGVQVERYLTNLV